MKRFVRVLREGLRVVLRRPVPSVVVVPVLPDGRVVFVRSVDSGLWGFPGGFIDWGETIEEAGRRELREETGLTATGAARLFGVYSSPARDPRLHSLAIALEIPCTGTPSPRDILEIAAAAAFPRDAPAPGPYTHDHDEVWRDWVGGEIVVR